MGSSTSRVSDMGVHEPEGPDVSGVMRDPYNSGQPRDPGFMPGVLLGFPLGIGATLIVLALTGVLVTICGG